MSEWVSVKERMPELHKDVFVAIRYGGKWSFDVTWLNSSSEWVSPRAVNAEVKFWMPIPDVPEAQ